MDTIFLYIREYVRAEWNMRYVVPVAILLAALFVINYVYDFEFHVLSRIRDPLLQTAFYFTFYAVPYLLTLIAYAASRNDFSFFGSTKFWIGCVTCLFIVSVYISSHNIPAYVYTSYPHVFEKVPRNLRGYGIMYTSNVLPGVLAILLSGTYWYFADRDRMRLYGLNPSGISISTYVGILLLLMPVVFVASFNADFQSAYPRYKFNLPEGVGTFNQMLLVAGFEFCYGIDFVFVEFVFRGLLVLALARFLGAGAILPMVVVYAMIHFQKPLGEALGSIVGGLVLGVISYRTQSILGGVILHLGVAYLMEGAGTVQMVLLASP